MQIAPSISNLFSGANHSDRSNERINHPNIFNSSREDGSKKNGLAIADSVSISSAATFQQSISIKQEGTASLKDGSLEDAVEDFFDQVISAFTDLLDSFGLSSEQSLLLDEFSELEDQFIDSLNLTYQDDLFLDDLGAKEDAFFSSLNLTDEQSALLDRLEAVEEGLEEPFELTAEEAAFVADIDKQIDAFYDSLEFSEDEGNLLSRIAEVQFSFEAELSISYTELQFVQSTDLQFEDFLNNIEDSRAVDINKLIEALESDDDYSNRLLVDSNPNSGKRDFISQYSQTSVNLQFAFQSASAQYQYLEQPAQSQNLSFTS
ncbi:hypothetical protein N9W34_02410 [Rickettsiales bacterium]|nr:hypothetical protein [Rickettsiales bacterium]